MIHILLFLTLAVSNMEYKKPNEEELKKKLSKEEYSITQQCNTEPPFRNKYWDHKEEGIYVDVVTGEPLFSSTDKFDSGTGWPSFTKPIDSKHIVEKVDSSHGMNRIEVKSKAGDSHLGHVFQDGPREHGGLRFCINSASLNFIPKNELATRGYAKYLYLFDKKK